MGTTIPFSYRAMTLTELSLYYGRDSRTIYKRWIVRLPEQWQDRDYGVIILAIDFNGIEDKGYVLTPKQLKILTNHWELTTQMENDLKPIAEDKK